MNSAHWNLLSPPLAARTKRMANGLSQMGAAMVVASMLVACTVAPETKHTEEAAKTKSAHEPDSGASFYVYKRPSVPERTWSVPPAAVEVNKGSVTPYPGEPESGEGVTAYGAGLRPPADPRAGNARDGDDEPMDDDPLSVPGVLVGKGLASWYGGQFHGRLTANGERFDRGALTAAHRTLPFGSKLCVRNISTGKTVMVRVNDRGPFAPGRIIDLSQAAAQELGIQGLGIKQVELWKLDAKSDSCPDELMTADAGDAGDADDAASDDAQVSSRVPIAAVSSTTMVKTQAAHSSRPTHASRASGAQQRKAAVRTSGGTRSARTAVKNASVRKPQKR